MTKSKLFVPIAFVLILGAGIAGIGFLGYLYPPEPIVIHKIIKVVDPNEIPSAREIQERLKALGNPRYDPGKIDGIPGPKMIRGWDNYVMDRYAKKCFEGENHVTNKIKLSKD